MQVRIKVKQEQFTYFTKEDPRSREGLNIAKKHVKPSQAGQGGIEEFPAPIHVMSNVKLVDLNQGSLTRGLSFRRQQKDAFREKSNETI